MFSVGCAKSFGLGAATALAAVWIARRVLSFRERNDDPPAERRSNGTAAPRCRAPKASEEDRKEIVDTPDLDQRIIRKAEAVIRWRTSRITVVVERCTDDHNYSAILRTAEALGIQNIWLIDPPVPPTIIETEDDEVTTTYTTSNNNGDRPRKQIVSEKELRQRAMHHLFARKATDWLTIREFKTTKECMSEMRNTGHSIWVTDLGQEAVTLTPEGLSKGDDYYKRYLDGDESFSLPPKVAIVMGTEAVGCSDELLQAADKRVYLPLRGFADSLNLSVATALVLQQLFILDPTVIGAMPERERRQLRLTWFTNLCKQRLLSSGQKRKRTRLLSHIRQCEKIQSKVNNNEELQPGETEKLAGLDQYRRELKQLEEAAHLDESNEGSAITKVVRDLVDHPPSPLTDLRRTDSHRVAFVGKNTKKKHVEHWENMAATTGYNTQEQEGVSSGFFRQRVQQVTKSNQL